MSFLVGSHHEHGQCHDLVSIPRRKVRRSKCIGANVRPSGRGGCGYKMLSRLEKKLCQIGGRYYEWRMRRRRRMWCRVACRCCFVFYFILNARQELERRCGGRNQVDSHKHQRCSHGNQSGPRHWYAQMLVERSCSDERRCVKGGTKFENARK